MGLEDLAALGAIDGSVRRARAAHLAAKALPALAARPRSWTRRDITAPHIAAAARRLVATDSEEGTP
jgi:hypothetical protein